MMELNVLALVIVAAAATTVAVSQVRCRTIEPSMHLSQKLADF
jgi:hypothetical protein